MQCVYAKLFPQQLTEVTDYVILQWVPAHCGIPEHGRADTLTIEDAEREQIEDTSTYREAKTVIRRGMKNRWHEKHLDSRITEIYHQLTRKEHSVSPWHRTLDFEGICTTS